MAALPPIDGAGNTKPVTPHAQHAEQQAIRFQDLPLLPPGSLTISCGKEMEVDDRGDHIVLEAQAIFNVGAEEHIRPTDYIIELESAHISNGDLEEIGKSKVGFGANARLKPSGHSPLPGLTQIRDGVTDTVSILLQKTEAEPAEGIIQSIYPAIIVRSNPPPSEELSRQFFLTGLFGIGIDDCQTCIGNTHTQDVTRENECSLLQAQLDVIEPELRTRNLEIQGIVHIKQELILNAGTLILRKGFMREEMVPMGECPIAEVLE